MERDFNYDFDSYEELDEYDDYECVTDDCFEYEWTEEDTWYALPMACMVRCLTTH